ncbi:DUF4333 domain-containing protein [Haloechinothrix halophila]|uniref:DUF4333 domain-containing protein n=1 Tax=Haloechinothrix halophila TaxID=1069073 RepID=UPI000687C461|nr:DUF4333 domain-containing protein [Haloechinothrix halophila]
MQITRTVKASAIALALTGFGATGCTFDVGGGVETSPSVPRERVERIVKERLTETVGRSPDSVSCKDGLEATIDASIRCTLTADGETHGLTATVTGIEGGTVNFHIQVDDKAFR